MPCDPRLWLINPISSTYPACQAVLAAREQGRPRPVIEAELWGLAREWRLRPVRVLTGTLWELP
jgi:hypothetical protein